MALPGLAVGDRPLSDRVLASRRRDRVMCGIVGLQLRDSSLYPQLGALLTDMLCHVAERGPDSAGFGVYGEPPFVPADSGAPTSQSSGWAGR